MRITLIAAMVLASTASMADEGQWQPHQMPSINDKLKERGINIGADKLADLTQHPMNAVVSLGYCTASFVSPQGLVVTNHHCAYSAIQYNSKKEHNYLADGFLASSLDQEPSAGPNERLYVTEAVNDVTAAVLQNVSLEPLARYQDIQANKKALIKACEADDNYRCAVRSFHNGLEYYLIKQLILRDVRLVYAPPESVGSFGGDIDNYEYPRHSGDFTFLRAYVSKDGTPAAYSEDNVPYQPKSYLTINGNGVKAGDGVFVAGYPGSTSRYRLTSELVFAKEWLYPVQAERYQRQIDTIKQISQQDEAVKIAYASTLASYANRMKKLNGLLAGFKATDIVSIKAQRQARFAEWLAQQQLGSDISQQLEALIERQQQLRQTQFYFSNAQSSAMLQAATRLYRWSKEQQQPDEQREAGYQERDRKMFSAGLTRIDSRFAPAVDKTLWLQDLNAYLAQEHRVAALDEILHVDTATDSLAAKIDGMYSLTGLTDTQTRLAWMDKPASEFESSSDPFIRLAVALYDANMADEQANKQLTGELSMARPAMMQAIIAYYRANDWPVYPDANGTLRISYGMVDGYQSADGLYKQPFTRLEGITAKHTGHEPFNAPAKLLTAIDNGRLGDHKVDSVYQDTRGYFCRLLSCEASPAQFNSVPVNFLSSVDTTGGNSGSPIFNGQGQLVGLNFDSTYEAITKDWFFNPTITRAVHVDIRYILWMMDKVDNAHNVIEELTIVKE
ncbi:S46 family peptidase [Shewanella sp. NIFS-20-20]|uniref:S46 family peptidase n=1 Tax=Shewanella sp. NIFS-20-20 TaxID=2853806 RepID=UPI001C4828AC|nr:S46 family peptidase [Shewanella sp. NIFS-20-20]MBV7317065.1 S46 family peptidase [Shewanella sp. NIFS-20-20]